MSEWVYVALGYATAGSALTAYLVVTARRAAALRRHPDGRS